VKRMKVSIESTLRCFHLTTTQIPFLRLTRIKVEEMYKRPQIVVIHDFLSDNEINTMKSLAKPRLQRSTVLGTPETGMFVVAESRVAEGGWLVDTDDQVVHRITRRIGDITGLDAMSADSYNCIKYGVGGHYVYHYDFAAPADSKIGDDVYATDLKRIATWINYLSDVEAGGATIFPFLNVAIKPRKGAALFWYNMKRSGFADLTTTHGGCPVLVGAKWIATKWIFEAKQEFHKPCGPDKHELNLLDKNV
jgi:prolyl 4-hydroxylase